MSDNTEERIKALEVALENELREKEFYLKHSERTKNPLGKRMFQTIANEEAEHYEKILELHKKLKQEGKWTETISLKVKQTEVKSVLKKILDSIDTSVGVETDDIEAIRIAIDFETKGEAFYKKLYEQVDDSGEKEFYKMLMTMEREHRLSLEDAYEYISDPEGWFHKVEGHHMDGI